MTPQRHERMSQLFTEAVKRSPEERDAYLNDACPDDPELRAEVVKLLAADERAIREKFLEFPWMATDGAEAENRHAWPLSTPLLRWFAELKDMATQQQGEAPRSIRLDQTPHQNGTPTSTVDKPSLPGYEIQGELGCGGMGIVYRARQTSLNRIVALKMILTGAEVDGEQQSRFRTEAEAVARLQHPNIVQIYEVGEHAGRAFLVLEYVQGGNLAEQLKGMPQPTDAVARFIETLARAIHYAHERGIIHRDLKPANILLSGEWPVTSGEKRSSNSSLITHHSPLATPKISDFGLAKLLRDEGESLAGGERTPTGMILGTPQYMAPEQARGPRQAIGRSADVYALGAILYEMLTGRPAFQGETPLETLEQARLQEPVAPSRLRPKLPRDLETICLKCLRKEPAQRYATAEDLAEDLRRFLAGEPIRARPLAAWSRALKWARRRPATAASLAATSVVLVGSLAGGLWYNAQLHAALARADHERERAEAKSQEAVEAAERAKNVLNYFVETFRRADPSQDGEGATIVEALKRSAQELPGNAELDPATRGALLNVIGQTYLGLGLPHEAVDVLEQTLALRRDGLGPHHADTLESMDVLGTAYHAIGRSAKAVHLLEETLKLRSARLGTEHRDTLASMNNLGAVYRAEGRLVDSLSLLENAVKLMKAKLGPGHRGTLASMNHLSLAYRDAGRLDDAIPLLEEPTRLLAG